MVCGVILLEMLFGLGFDYGEVVFGVVLVIVFYILVGGLFVVVYIDLI